MRTMLCLIQGRDEPTEAYYIQFEVAISTAELAKCNVTTHIELNKAYADGYDEDGTNRFQTMCLIMSADSDQYSGIWNYLNNITLLGTEKYPKTTTAANDVLSHYNKLVPPRQAHVPPVAVTIL